MTGTRPAHDTRFGSSTVARTTGMPWRNLTCEVGWELFERDGGASTGTTVQGRYWSKWAGSR
jgi:hypothetical protein